MSDDHSARSGSLHAHLQAVTMEIDDDDEDVILVVIELVNESSIPVGGLEAALVSDKGQRFEATEGISSIGPGLTRQFKFEARMETGTWTFEFSGGGQSMSLGPYEAAFEFQAEQGRKLGNAIGTSLFSGAFDNHLDDFGQVEERGIINPDSIIMTSYVGENMEGGGTKVLKGDSVSITEDSDAPRTPPWEKKESSEPLTALAPPSQMSNEPSPALDPLLSTPLAPLSVEETPASNPPVEAPPVALEAPPTPQPEVSSAPPPLPSSPPSSSCLLYTSPSPRD